MEPKKTRALARVLNVAAERFLHKRFEEVSVAEIAEAARCSNNTIYDVFGTKEGLYRAAVGHSARGLEAPSLETSPDLNPLVALLKRADAWLNIAKSDLGRRLFATISGHSQKLHALMEEEESDPQGHWAAMKTDAHRCIDQGYLRPMAVNVALIHIVSCVLYMPLCVHALYGTAYQVGRVSHLSRTFQPLLTEAGSEIIEEFLSALAADGSSDQDDW